MLIPVSYVCLKGDAVDNDASPIASPTGDIVPLFLVHQLSPGRALRRPAWRALLPTPRSSPSSARAYCGRPAAHLLLPLLLVSVATSAPARASLPHRRMRVRAAAGRRYIPPPAAPLRHGEAPLLTTPRSLPSTLRAIDVLAHPGPLKASHPPPTPLPASQPPPPLQSGLAGLPRM